MFMMLSDNDYLYIGATLQYISIGFYIFVVSVLLSLSDYNVQKKVYKKYSLKYFQQRAILWWFSFDRFDYHGFLTLDF